MVNFFKGLLSPRQPGIGIEIASDRINIIQLEKKAQALKLGLLASIEVPEDMVQEGQIVDPPGMAELIRALLAENKIKAKRVATAIPGREAVIRLIPVPAELNEEELRDYMNAEAGLYLPFPREDADVDYQKIGLFVDDDGVEKVQVVLVATRREVTDTYIETFREAGLDIDVLEVTSFALIRTLKDQLQQFSSQEAAVLTDIEFDSTELAIVVDGIPQFNRTIPIGTYQIQTALNQAMNLPPTRDTSELQGMTLPVTDTMGASGDTNPGTNAMIKVLGELADELRRSVDFYLNQSEELEVAQLLLAGPGAAIGKLDEFFMQRLSLPASQVDPIDTLGLEITQEITPEQRAGLGVALGLGLREVL
ncbi:type IV pilus assembly protein PilM [Microcoleus sp. bin38.metabat.b11b12b14.051]|uniref:type IV pilus assembly protein PilM n=1 Tax=Microcoleus sp. bin38.metabat.b11b12b14.051 TaxID=2742709 RepID=UPI0025F23EB7|nr:type IV pilus assembly protein PilM [Microcoleus sp. bin38.metabat.b11b12b14.051]